MRNIIRFFLAVSAILLFGCGLNLDPEIEESYRVASPDGAHTMTLARYNFHATTGFSYRISLFETNRSSSAKDGVDILITDSVEGTEIRWLDQETLIIRCLAGTVYSWQNRVDFKRTSIRIEVNSMCGGEL